MKYATYIQCNISQSWKGKLIVKHVTRMNSENIVCGHNTQRNRYGNTYMKYVGNSQKQKTE